MNLAVKLYSSESNKPQGIPDNWPSKVVEIGNLETLPENCPNQEGWILMSLEDFNTHKELYQEDYNTWYLNYTSPTAQDIIKNKILASMEFGKNLMAEYGASNVLAGFSLEQIKYIIEQTKKVQDALASGSLYVAIDELNALITDETLITVEKVTECRNKIERYLGIPET